MVALNLATLGLAASFFASFAAAEIDSIVIKGSKFFYKSNGTQFFIKGVAYQQDIGAGGASSANKKYLDPLTDTSGCQRDIPYLKRLHTNTVRVYAIDPSGDHDSCMQMLADNDIYVIADLSSPDASIDSTSPQWNTDLYERYSSVIDTMAKYPNTLGFFAGNEVSNQLNNSNAMPFVKAAVRDMKAYIKTKKYRDIGVGYASDDGASVVAPIEDFLNCGDQKSAIDFFGYNIYSWCGHSSFRESHYQQHTIDFANYSVPAFFAEYGCIDPRPRTFEDTPVLYSEQMTKVWSGGIVFEYFQAENNYGLVELEGNQVRTLSDYNVLSRQIAKATPTGVQMNSYQPTNQPRDCPDGATFPGWAVATHLPPPPNAELCLCMARNLNCVAKKSVQQDAYTSLFSAACDPRNGRNICDGIAADGTTGQYGAYSMCSPIEQLSWAMNALFQEQQQSNPDNTDACDFAGNATTQSGTLSSQCNGLLNQAGGQAGTAEVTAEPTGNPKASGSKNAAPGSGPGSMDTALLMAAGYVIVAVASGAGMILL